MSPTARSRRRCGCRGGPSCWSSPPDDVGTVLAATPDPFHPVRTDEVAALRQFEPHAVLVARDRGRPRAGVGHRHPALAPFGAGPGECPGRNLVLFTTSTMLAVMRASHDYRLVCDHGLTRRDHLPATLDNLSLRFTVTVR